MSIRPYIDIIPFVYTMSCEFTGSSQSVVLPAVINMTTTASGMLLTLILHIQLLFSDTLTILSA